MFQGLNIIKYISNIPSCSILMFRLWFNSFFFHTLHTFCQYVITVVLSFVNVLFVKKNLFVVHFSIAYDTLNVGHSGVLGKMLVEQAEQDGQNENTYLLICRNIYHVLVLAYKHMSVVGVGLVGI